MYEMVSRRARRLMSCALVLGAGACADAVPAADTVPAAEGVRPEGTLQQAAPASPQGLPPGSQGTTQLLYGGSGCVGKPTHISEPDGFRIGFIGFELRASQGAPALTRDCALAASTRAVAGWQSALNRVAVTGYAILPPGGSLSYGVRPGAAAATPALGTHTVRGEHFGRWSYHDEVKTKTWSRCGQASQVDLALPVTVNSSSDALVQVRSMFVELAWRRCSS